MKDYSKTITRLTYNHIDVVYWVYWVTLSPFFEGGGVML